MFQGQNKCAGVRHKESDGQGVTAEALSGVKPAMDPSSSTGIS